MSERVEKCIYETSSGVVVRLMVDGKVTKRYFPKRRGDAAEMAAIMREARRFRDTRKSQRRSGVTGVLHVTESLKRVKSRGSGEVTAVYLYLRYRNGVPPSGRTIYVGRVDVSEGLARGLASVRLSDTYHQVLQMLGGA